MKLLLKSILITAVLLIAFIANVMISTGYFRTIENKFDGELLKEVVLPGAEDITISQSEGFALISSNDRTATNRADWHGGLYHMDLTSGDFELTNLTSTFQKYFAPHGISMLKKDGTYQIMAINHTPTGHTVEVFNMNGKKLTHERTLTDKSMISPNDIVVIGENRFYFTNDHAYTEGIGRLLEDYGGLAVSNVIYFDGENYREVASDIGYANGINFDPKRNLMFVASPRKFLVKVFSRNTDGSLEFIEDIPCATGVDNIEFDTDGNLWIGAHPSLLTFSAYHAKKKEFSPSEIIKINYYATGDYEVEQIYLNDGTAMSASTVAAPFSDLVITGNYKDDKFLVLKKDN